MIDASQVIRKLLEARSPAPDQAEPDWNWVKGQPNMSSLDAACKALGDEIVDWIKNYTKAFYSDSETREAGDDAESERRERQILKVWSVLRHHWKEGIEFFDSLDNSKRPWSDIAQFVRDGRGFKKKNKRSDDSENVGHRDSGFEMRLSRLGGNPIRDILLVDSMVDGNSEAITLFQQEYRNLAERIYFKYRKRKPDHHWWDTLSVDLMYLRQEDDDAQPRRIGRYSGGSGLSRLVTTSVSRSVKRRTKKEPIPDQLQHLTPGEQLHDLRKVISSERFAELVTQIASRVKASKKQPTLAQIVENAWLVLTNQEFLEWERIKDDHIEQKKAEIIDRTPPTQPDVMSEGKECRNKLKRLLVEAVCNTERIAEPDSGTVTALNDEERLVLWMVHAEKQLQKEVARHLHLERYTVSRLRKTALRRITEFIAYRMSQNDEFAKGCRACRDELFSVPLEDLLAEAVTESFSSIAELLEKDAAEFVDREERIESKMEGQI